MSTRFIDEMYKNINKQSRKRGEEISFNFNTSDYAIESYLYMATSIASIDRIKNVNGVCSAVDVNNAAKIAIPLVESEIKELVNKYPEYYWRYFLARLPRELFYGALDTTFTFAIHLFKSCISFSSHKIDTEVLYKDGNQVIISATDERQKDYFKLLGYSRFLKDLYVILRTSSKGVDYHYTDGHPIPERVEVESVIKAIELFDNRNDIGINLSEGGYLPTKSGFSLEQLKIKHKSDIVLVVNDVIKPYKNYIPKSFKRPKAKKYTLINYELFPFDLKTIYTNFTNDEVEFPWKVELLEIIALLKFSSWCISKGWVFGPYIYEHGYYLLEKKFVHSFMSTVVDEINQEFKERFGLTISLSGDELIRKYSSPLSSDIYPGNCSILFDAGSMVGVDMAAAFPLLYKTLEYTKKQGNIANVRGDFFEVQTQGLIDESKYKPETCVYKTIGKNLKFNGKDITDFDAILTKDNILVAISCKSMLLTDEYDKGDYKSIRNIKASIEKYVDDWKAKVKLVNENKIGDNYDYSSYEKVVGLVLTPTVFYVDIDYHNELEVKGLFESMSFNELDDWVNKT